MWSRFRFFINFEKFLTKKTFIVFQGSFINKIREFYINVSLPVCTYVEHLFHI